jgi:hypothetical protein
MIYIRRWSVGILFTLCLAAASAYSELGFVLISESSSSDKNSTLQKSSPPNENSKLQRNIANSNAPTPKSNEKFH